jgi:hypothetical protein
MIIYLRKTTQKFEKNVPRCNPQTMNQFIMAERLKED